MLFARTYPGFDHETLRQRIEENMCRGYSWWYGKHDPSLPCEPGHVWIENVRERMAAFADAMLRPEEKEKHAPRRNERGELIEPIPGDQRLPGLCAVCSANSYQELAERIWKDRHDPNGWIGGRVPTIAIFEGDPVANDPDGWTLFIPRKLLAVADVRGIARASVTKLGALPHHTL